MTRFAIQVVQGYISTRFHCFGCRLRKELHTTTTKWGARKYYTSQQVSTFVHITFMHSPTSTEDDMKILREYHFYISDDWSHSTEFVHGYFQLFYEIWLIGAYHIVITLFGQTITHLNSRMHRCSIGWARCIGCLEFNICGISQRLVMERETTMV